MLYPLRHNLSFVWKELQRSCESPNRGNRYELKELLKTLQIEEKIIVVKLFCRLPWNIGSLYTLSVLQELRFLTATDYILGIMKREGEAVQLILNDFLEAEYKLIANLFKTTNLDNVQSVRLKVLLDDCINNLYRDLIERPELSEKVLGYLAHLSSEMTEEALHQVLRKHLRILLHLEKGDVRDAFANFSNWLNEAAQKSRFLDAIYDKLLSEIDPEESLSYLFQYSTGNEFTEWKYYLLLLHTIANRNPTLINSFINKELKQRIKQCCLLDSSVESVLHLLLTARAVTAQTKDIARNLDHYANWYKTSIVEIKFCLSDTDEFQKFIHLLQECIEYEQELDSYLSIHATFTISAPILCGKLVQTYKSKCKQHLTQLVKICKGEK